MNVKRYDFDCYAFYDSARLDVQECEDGDYVLHADYATLLSSHNALREAVATLCATTDNCEVHANEPAISCYQRARAEVDRLLSEDSNDGNS